ncbi:MAG TPA: zinc ribbon domain-containing protein [Solirubrobacterales bacterium]|nr:zinc ribbon domain-containing protein [Solirubrobacterales bacterium]
MPAGLFGITDDTLNLVVNLLIVFLVFVWVALVAWTFFDARRRIDDPWLVGFATFGALLPYVGSLIYSILRPPELIEERHERELEIRASELRVRQLEEQSCPNCEHPIQANFLRCPSCRARIKTPCPACEEPVDPRWSVCPYCETALRRVASAGRRPETAQKRRAEKPQPPEEPAKQRRRQPAARGSSPAPSAAPGDGEQPRTSPAQRQARTSKSRSERPREPSSSRRSSKPRS